MSKSCLVKSLTGMGMLSVVLSGCTLAPQYSSPALPVPNHYRGTHANEPSGAQASNIGWKSYFTNPDMQHLITTALSNNRDLRISMLNVQKTAANFRIQDSRLLPELDGNLSSLGQRIPANTAQNQEASAVTSHDSSANVGISSWEIDFFGRLRSLKTAALDQYLAQVATLRSARISLVSDVVQGYVTLAADRSLLRVSTRTAETQRKLLDLKQVALKYGNANEQDVAQLEMALQSANVAKAQYQRAVDQDINALQLLMGSPVPQKIITHAYLENIASFKQLPAGTPSSLLTQRPDIVAAEEQLKASNANIGAARAAFFPSISLTASAGSASNSLGHLFAGGQGAWSFEPSVNIPIFDWGRRQAELDISKLDKRSDIANYQKVIQQAFREVSDALSAGSTYRDELVAREKDMAASQHYYNLAELRYQQGEDSSLNALVAERSLFDSRLNLIATRLSSLNQQITLYKVLGGGWKE